MKIQQIQELNEATVATIRTAEMADVSCILFVRGKRVTDEMLAVASENNMILLETEHSMYHTVGELYCSGLLPIF